MRVVGGGDGPKGDLNRLWISCSPSEKVALYQLAHEKWPNLKNADALRHLWNRRILCHNKRFVFRDEAFERFVLNNVSTSEQEKLAQRQSGSSWAGIKSALLILAFGVVAAIVLVLGEQMWSTIITVAGAATYLFRLTSTMRGEGLLAMLPKGTEKA
jgi:Flp pilus assembly protein TadB